MKRDSQIETILKDYESMSIKDLKKEMRLARNNIVILNSEINTLKKNSSSFSFLLNKPPESQPSILKQAANIEIIDSSNADEADLFYDVDESENAKSIVNIEKIQKNLQDNMNMSLSTIIENHNEEVHNIKFEAAKVESVAKYFPK